MKKSIWITITIFLVIICMLTIVYTNYSSHVRETKKQNVNYEYYLGKEVYGSDMTTIMNRAMDQNKKNGVEKNKNGFYQDNGENSIQIDIHMTEVDKTYAMEAFYKVGIQEFITTFNQISFTCTDIQYHAKTGKVKYLLFEEIM